MSSRGCDEGSKVLFAYMRGPRQPPPPPPEKSQSCGISSQYWSEFLETPQNYQASIQCWVMIGVSLAGRWWVAKNYIWILSTLSPHQLKKYMYMKKTCLSWTLSDKSYWIRACFIPRELLVYFIKSYTFQIHIWLSLGKYQL